MFDPFAGGEKKQTDSEFAVSLRKLLDAEPRATETVIYHLLKRLGFCSPVARENVELVNFGVGFARELAKLSPRAALRVLERFLMER